MNSFPLVSVIIPTRNSAQFLEACLQSIKNQTYKNIEIIVVDNNSTDNTKEIAKKYTKLVFNKGPERSAQRNFGAKNSNGEYLLFIDSDMELTPKVIENCVAKIQSNNKTGAIIIPEESFGKGFWAQCKKLERSYYIGIEWIEAARFYKKSTFLKADGFDENLIAGEDWDLSQRVSILRNIERINDLIYHNEGKIELTKFISKKFYYGKRISLYLKKQTYKKNSQINPLSRYILFFKKPDKILRNPVVFIGMIILKTIEMLAFGLGYLVNFLFK